MPTSCQLTLIIVLWLRQSLASSEFHEHIPASFLTCSLNVQMQCTQMAIESMKFQRSCQGTMQDHWSGGMMRATPMGSEACNQGFNQSWSFHHPDEDTGPVIRLFWVSVNPIWKWVGRKKMKSSPSSPLVQISETWFEPVRAGIYFFNHENLLDL